MQNMRVIPSSVWSKRSASFPEEKNNIDEYDGDININDKDDYDGDTTHLMTERDAPSTHHQRGHKNPR